MLDYVRVRKDRDPVAIGPFGRLDAIHTEAARQTSNTTEYRLESLALMVRNVVLKHCDARMHVRYEEIQTETASYLESC